MRRSTRLLPTRSKKKKRHVLNINIALQAYSSSPQEIPVRTSGGERGTLLKRVDCARQDKTRNALRELRADMLHESRPLRSSDKNIITIQNETGLHYWFLTIPDR